MTKYTKFIPTQFFNISSEQWELVYWKDTNYIEKFGEEIKKVIQLENGWILCDWETETTLYKGILE